MTMDYERRETRAGHVFAVIGAISFFIYLANSFAIKHFLARMTLLIEKFIL